MSSDEKNTQLLGPVTDYLSNFLRRRGSKVVSCDGNVVRNGDGRDERGDVLK